MKNIKYILLIFFVVISAISEESIDFNLNKCIEYAIKNSPSAKAAKASFRARTNRIKAFNSGFYPQLSFNTSLPGLSREIISVTQPDGSSLFQPQSQYFGSGGLSLSQVIAPLGSQFTVSTGLTRIDVFGTRDYSIWRTTPVMLSYNQPIFGYNSLKWESKVQDIKEEINDKEYSSEIESISMIVTQKFFDVYIAKMNVKNSMQNVNVNDTLYTISKGRFEVGKIAENDLLQSELAFLNAKNSYQSALLDYKQKSEEFQTTIGLNKNTIINLIPPMSIPELKINEEFALRQALENNPDFRNIEIENLQADIALLSAESSNSISANLNASFGLNNSSDLLPNAYRELLQQQRFDITLQIPLYQFGKGNALIEAALQEKNRTQINTELRKKNLEIEVKYETLRLIQLINQVEIAAKADTIASRRFEVAINRYYIGKIDLNSFFIAQNEKDTAFQSYIQILKSFRTSYYNLRRQTLYDFENNKKINHLLEN